MVDYDFSETAEEMHAGAAEFEARERLWELIMEDTRREIAEDFDRE